MRTDSGNTTNLNAKVGTKKIRLNASGSRAMILVDLDNATSMIAAWECQLLAHSRHSNRTAQCLLSGVKRTSRLPFIGRRGPQLEHPRILLDGERLRLLCPCLRSQVADVRHRWRG